MYAADELEEECLFYFFVPEDGGEEAVCHVVVFVGVLFDQVDYFALGLGEVAVNFLPYLLLVKLEFRSIFVELLLLILPHELVELVVLHLDVYRAENKLVAQVSYAFQTTDPALSLCHPPRLVASRRQLRLLPRLEHAR